MFFRTVPDVIFPFIQAAYTSKLLWECNIRINLISSSNLIILIPSHIYATISFYIPLSCRRKTDKASALIHVVFLGYGIVNTLTDIEFSIVKFLCKAVVFAIVSK